MIIKLNNDGTINIQPQTVPERIESIYIEYIFPKGLNHLKPILTWGEDIVIGDNKYVTKHNNGFDMKVELYDGDVLYKTYRNNEEPDIYIGYAIESIVPNILKYINELETENRELKERGDLI